MNTNFLLVFLFVVRVHAMAPIKMYFAIAATPSGQSYSRAFNKTLTNITQSYAEEGGFYNVTLETLAIEMPENGSFSARLLKTVCEQFEGKHVVAVLLVGDSPAAFTISMAAKHSGIPVLWARGHSGFLPGFRRLESSPLEVQLAPTGRELVQAMRELLLQAHWHTFTLLADAASATSLQRPELWATLSAAPLHPTLITLPVPLRPQNTFRKLADISRSTRGVVVLFSDRPVAIRILDEAKRLNMLDGHFVWLWVDTAENMNFTRNHSEDAAVASVPEDRPKVRNKRQTKRDGLGDVHASYLLQNDRFLLFNGEFGIGEGHKVGFVGGEGYRAGGERISELPAGLLSLKAVPVRIDRHLVKGAARLLIATLKVVLGGCSGCDAHGGGWRAVKTSCWRPLDSRGMNFSNFFARELKAACSDALAGRKFIQEIGVEKVDKSLVANFDILNLVPDHTLRESELGGYNRTETDSSNERWKRVGIVAGRSVRLDTIVWPGGDLSVAAVSTRARTVFRVVTALAPPFVMESELDEDGQCLRGLPCHRVLTSDKDNLTLVFNEMKRIEEEEDENEENQSNSEYKHIPLDYEDGDRFFPFQKFKYRTNCCYGLVMDLLENVAQELEFDFRLYIAADGLFGSKTVVRSERKKRDVGKKFLSYRFKDDLTKQVHAENEYQETPEEVDVKWNGIVGDLVSGAAHMSFAALSVSSARSEVIDFSVPYFFSGVSFLAAPQQKSEIPLMAFLLPFSPELWIAIFTSLNITAIAVAIYEWLSPFGLNPWGRQRSKNFSMSSALWVMWGLLCGHLVAFKAPKSWPNKFLINVWGGFSVIFVASYTANIAALIAGLFFHNTVSNYHDRSLLSQKVGAPRSSAAEYYVQKANRLLWEHMRKYSLLDVEDGIDRLRNGSLDILIADTPILDYYRATDHGCKLQKIGDTINEDTYAIGMTKGFPLKDSISAVIAKYSSNGYMDILQEKWYGGLPCFKLPTELAQPRPLGVAAVTGVFILLGVGMVLGCLILLIEHLFFRYTLPILRDKPKDSIWRSRNIMFFSQKLYRFINCVELVSPHHAARELVHTIRQGQITSLFQKSIKRKEHEQRRRRKSKAQFFEMIQEIRSNLRRQQQEEREPQLESVREVDSEYQISPEEKRTKLSPSIIRRTFLRTSPKNEGGGKKSPTGYFHKQLFSPRSKNKTRSSTTLNVRRFSSDGAFNPQVLKPDRSSAVGRRLSKDVTFLSSSPPDINSRRSSYLDIISTGSKLSGKSPVLSIENVSDSSAKSADLTRKLSDSESIGRKLATLPKYKEPFERNRLQPQYSLTIGKSDETLTKSGTHNLEQQFATAQSYHNISENDKLVGSGEFLGLSSEQKSNLSDDEIARRNQMTIKQLQSEITGGSSHLKSSKRTTDNNLRVVNTNPQIRIQVEDTSQPPPRREKARHRSLGDASKISSLPEPMKRSKLPEQSRSLDHPPSKSRCREQNLPPAPPPPNCSPRNSDGRSPLERLSKDELVLLWRSSESELRSHLLKAIREKEDAKDPT